MSGFRPPKLTPVTSSEELPIYMTHFQRTEMLELLKRHVQNNAEKGFILIEATLVHYALEEHVLGLLIKINYENNNNDAENPRFSEGLTLYV